mmetsp:Transcript_25365/g.83407  ORF Transcript_25365/g.83407 Transcript_25365/m.83407 type:complete len:231 (+) Transcript_25365:249-941(+)
MARRRRRVRSAPLVPAAVETEPRTMGGHLRRFDEHRHYAGEDLRFWDVTVLLRGHTRSGRCRVDSVRRVAHHLSRAPHPLEQPCWRRLVRWLPHAPLAPVQSNHVGLRCNGGDVDGRRALHLLPHRDLLLLRRVWLRGWYFLGGVQLLPTEGSPFCASHGRHLLPLVGCLCTPVAVWRHGSRTLEPGCMHHRPCAGGHRFQDGVGVPRLVAAVARPPQSRQARGERGGAA